MKPAACYLCAPCIPALAPLHWQAIANGGGKLSAMAGEDGEDTGLLFPAAATHYLSSTASL